ncbi:cation transporter [Puia sp. P3]|uniref:cation transporter n=1 Tax=Puia sp. P3 TaxID=3423952 RepID=UPI003D66E451
MGCADCERLVDHALLATPGVREVNTSFAKEEAVVRYDSARVSVGELGTVVERETDVAE